jgi:hypothetical protein
MKAPFRFNLALLLCLASASCYAPISVKEVRPVHPTPVVLNASDLEVDTKGGGSSPLVKAAGILDSLRVAHDRLAAGDARALPEYNYLTNPLVSPQRRPQAPHPKSKFLAASLD